MIKKSLLGLLFAVVVASSSAGSVRAQGTPPFSETIVAGMVYGTDGNPVNGGSVAVTCGSGSQTTSIASDGSYQAIFSQSQCKTGDTASAQATTSQGSGANSSAVQNTSVNGPVVDIDIAIVNVNIAVPEFGAVTGAISMMGAVASFVYLKSKTLLA